MAPKKTHSLVVRVAKSVGVYLLVNRRAIRVYERAGFEPVETFGATRLNGEKEWLLMRRDPPG